MDEDGLLYGSVDAGGAQTRYLTGGSDEANVLALHPGGLVPEVWLPLIARLTRHARVYAPDLLGHGLTDYPEVSVESPHRELVKHVLSAKTSSSRRWRFRPPSAR